MLKFKGDVTIIFAWPPSTGVESIISTSHDKLNPRGLHVKLNSSSISISLTSTEKVLKLTSASSSSNEKLVGLSKLKTGGSLIGLTFIKTLASFDSRLLFESISLSSTLKNKLSIPLKSWLGLYVTVPSLLLIILPLAGAKPFSIK